MFFKRNEHPEIDVLDKKIDKVIGDVQKTKIEPINGKGNEMTRTKGCPTSAGPNCYTATGCYGQYEQKAPRPGK